MNVFILVNLSGIDRSSVISFLDSRPEVRNWYQYENVFGLVATVPLMGMQSILHILFQGQPFLLTQTHSSPATNTAGYMPPDFWTFINNPTDSGHWPRINE